MTAMLVPLEVLSQNSTDRMHWRCRHREQQKWLGWLRLLGREAGLVLDGRRVRRSVRVTAYRSRLMTDHGNLVGGCKLVVDAIRDAGLIVDDADRWVSIAYEQRKASEHPTRQACTVIEVEDLP